jgi:hypothetical protein
VWNFPQVPDNISLNSYDEDTDVDSTLGTPLPESDLAFFDPLTEKDKSGQGTLRTSKSWIMEAVNTCNGKVIFAPVEKKSVDKTILYFL